MTIPVIQYSKELEEVARYDSIVEASNSTGVPASSISAACIYYASKKQAGGFYWCRQYDDLLDLLKHKRDYKADRNHKLYIHKMKKNKRFDAYGLDRVVYRGVDKPVILVCKEHGEFEHKLHYNRYSDILCPKCNINNKLNSRNQRIDKHHGDKYEYLFDIVTAKVSEKVKIKCPNHGIFEQRFDAHLRGFGCQKCHTDKIHRKNKITHSEYIKRVKEISPDMKVIGKYTGSDNKIEMECGNGHRWFPVAGNVTNHHRVSCPECRK
jgi:hypothetical protein